MIPKLTGKVDAVGAEWVILDVGGVGYVVHCGARTLSHLPAVGETASLAVETVVREDMIRLYGFAAARERDWFRLLQSVQGVGARVALAILSVLDGEGLVNAIAMQDHAAVARAHGVGPKLAKRIVAELRDRAPESGLILAASATATEAGAAPEAISPERLARADAVSALVNLGYGETQAAAAINAAVARMGGGADVGLLIREGLKELAR
jgi:Holliday junction DNA helicase RuvA